MINKAKLHGIIREVLMDNPWTLSNDILYKICKNYPSNIDKESVLAKTLIIGRVYSVALERGVGEKKTKGGEFYIKKCIPENFIIFFRTQHNRTTQRA